jgi:hypothetical protein
MRTTVIIMGLFLLLLSCERDVTIELKPHTPSLVVHAYVETGNSFEIAVGKTTSNNIISSINDNYVENATAILYEDGVEIDTMEYDASIQRYTSADTAYPGKTYKIVVQALGYKTVEATTTAPSVVNTTIVSYIKDARVDEDGNTLNDITFRFADPSGKDYYFVELNNFFNNSFCVYSYDPSIEEFQGDIDPFEANSCIDNDEIIITDRTFGGNTKEITLSASSFGMFEFDDGSGNLIRPYLKKYHITEEFYKYIKDGISVDIVGNNPFVEPHITGGNVRNGYGLFTVYSMTTDTLR